MDSVKSIPYLDVAITDDWFCYRCGEHGIFYDRQVHGHHSVIKFRYVIFPDTFYGPLYMDSGRVSVEQCTLLDTTESSGCQYVLNLPKNWLPITRYVIHHNEGTVLDADFNPIGESSTYVESLLWGKPYVPEGHE